jgi:nucleotide-binding universal stress UspA family protein
MKFERILCAVDFSPDSLQAFAVAMEMVRFHQGAVLVFHVIEAQPTVTADALIKINKEANDAMAELIASARRALEGITISSEVTTGRAYDEIANRAREWKAGLVVLGARGVTSLEEVIVGGTAESVVREAPCSVLVARPG